MLYYFGLAFRGQWWVYLGGDVPAASAAIVLIRITVGFGDNSEPAKEACS